MRFRFRFLLHELSCQLIGSSSVYRVDQIAYPVHRVLSTHTSLLMTDVKGQWGLVTVSGTGKLEACNLGWLYQTWICRRTFCFCCLQLASARFRHYTVKKKTRFLDLFWPNLLGTGNGYIIPGQGEFGKWHPGWGQEYPKKIFTVCCVNKIGSMK